MLMPQSSRHHLLFASLPAFAACLLLLVCPPLAGAEDEQQPAAPSGSGAERSDDREGMRSRARLGASNVGTLPSAGLIESAGLRGMPQDALPPSDKSRKRVEFVGTPIPVISPTIGNGVAGVGALAVYIDPDDQKSPPSIFGGGVLFTSNGTRAFGALSELFLKEDRFRIVTAFGKGRVNYDYYGVGGSSGKTDLHIPLTLDALVFMAEPKVRLFGRWFAGPRYLLMQSDVGLDLDLGASQEAAPGQTRIEIPEIDLSVRSAALGLRVERDSRDNQFYPSRGSLFDTQIDFFRPAFASKRSYEHVSVSFQGYHSLGKKNVLAYRGSVCSASGDVPFYSNCTFGQSKDIRGYAMGRYQDRRMLVGQAEYRRELFWRFGAVGFFGAGAVAEKFSKLSASKILPGGGLGVRFTLAKQNHINLRFDYAWGKESSALYVSLGESF